MMNFFAWGDLGRHCLSGKAVRSDHPINAHLEPVNFLSDSCRIELRRIGKTAVVCWEEAVPFIYQ